MFEDFNEKVGKLQISSTMKSLNVYRISPEIIKKLRKERIDPNNVFIQQLFSSTLDYNGIDSSLMSGVELEIMKTYARTHKY
jgi:hypothetical protein